jgi:hypothetical protein
MPAITHNQKVRCFGCTNFIDCTEAGDVRCEKETASVLNIVYTSTIQMCKNKNWRQVK